MKRTCKKYPKNRKSRSIDISGKRYGLLLVIKNVGKLNGHDFFWECLCDCGKKTVVRRSNLNSGKTKSCGCIKKRCFGGDLSPAGKNKKNLVGKKFNRLKVIKDSGERYNRQIVWECLCDCGKKTKVTGNKLTNSHTKSCGCYQDEIRIKNGLNNLKNFIDHNEKIKVYPKDAYTLPEKERAVKYMPDWYIKTCIKSRSRKKINRNDIIPEMIELQREIIKFKRIEKELNNVINRR